MPSSMSWRLRSLQMLVSMVPLLLLPTWQAVVPDIKLDQESKDLGGLKIIGTERHESRRIDNQLRGRSGRQGRPGESDSTCLWRMIC